MNTRLIERFVAARARTETLAAPLSDEDQILQSMPDCSPTKWHRAHTTWFFEAFALGSLGDTPDAARALLWNSYYEAVGPRIPRNRRGMMSRPTAAEVGTYRREIDARLVERLLALRTDDLALSRIGPLVELGIAHEEQHQELLLTDILNAFSMHPFAPSCYPESARERDSGSSGGPAHRPRSSATDYVAFEGGLVWIGAEAGSAQFSFDNEGPRHRVWLDPFELATRLVTIGDVKAFIAEGGYRTASLWLSAGWDFVRAEGIEAPLYASFEDGEYRTFGLHGKRTPSDGEPVSHISLYEADAIARFLGARLPSEAEWEHAVAAQDCTGGLRKDGEAWTEGPMLDVGEHGVASPLHPQERLAAPPDGLLPLHGNVWQWTRSTYAPYPGYAPAGGAVGEYNGKFMVNQNVLRGGSCLTPRGHLRPTYRNFWAPQTRFQMSGLRLARDGEKR